MMKDEGKRCLLESLAKNMIHKAETALNLGTIKKTFMLCNILELEVGTNAPKGGDTSHGGRTLFKLIDEGGTDWYVKIVDSEGEHYFELPKEVTIVLGGDSEAKTFAEALLFAGKYLKLRMKGKSNDKSKE